MKVNIRHAKIHECEDLYQLKHKDMTWKETDAPYFLYEKPDLEEFREGYFKRLCEDPSRKVIDVDGKIIGTICFYWEHEPTRWLEVGLAIFDKNYWGKGIGKEALIQWITEVFSTQEVVRVGLTTWSGNIGMMRLAEKLGMIQEACLRKVRYHNGIYYDSIRYGILREEWIARKDQVKS